MPQFPHLEYKDGDKISQGCGFTDEAFIMVPGPLRVIYIMALPVWKPSVGEGGLRVSSCVPVADFCLTAENHLGQTSGLSGL